MKHYESPGQTENQKSPMRRLSYSVIVSRKACMSTKYCFDLPKNLRVSDHVKPEHLEQWKKERRSDEMHNISSDSSGARKL